jgi:hypothetical protein
VNLYLTTYFDARRIQRQDATEKKLDKVLWNSKCITEMSSVKVEQGRPSSGLHEERLNSERHFGDREETGKGNGHCGV